MDYTENLQSPGALVERSVLGHEFLSLLLQIRHLRLQSLHLLLVAVLVAFCCCPRRPYPAVTKGILEMPLFFGFLSKSSNGLAISPLHAARNLKTPLNRLLILRSMQKGKAGTLRAHSCSCRSWRNGRCLWKHRHHTEISAICF